MSDRLSVSINWNMQQKAISARIKIMAITGRIYLPARARSYAAIVWRLGREREQQDSHEIHAEPGRARQSQADLGRPRRIYVEVSKRQSVSDKWSMIGDTTCDQI